MAWFLQNPAASNILPHNLPEGSRARTELEEIMSPGGIEDEDWAGGMPRRQVTHDYAGEQQRLYDLVEAKGVIQKALAARGDNLQTVIDFEADSWSAIARGQGRLEHFVRPRDIDSDLAG